MILPKLDRIREIGYDPRGNGTEVYSSRCMCCGARIHVSVPFRSSIDVEVRRARKFHAKHCSVIRQWEKGR